MESARADDADWRGGRIGVFVHYAGEDVLKVAKDAYAMFFTENGLGPAALKSLAKFECEVVQMTAGLLSGGAGVRGTMTTGGTESILLAMKCARDWARAGNRGGATPKVVYSETTQPAFDKSAHLLGMEVVRVPVRADLSPDIEGIARAVDARTVALVASAPNFPYGMVDPVREYAALAAKPGLWLHVDACVGGYIAPFARKLGRPIPDFDFAIPEVTTISADCHKYGYAAKGASTLLFRDETAFSHLAYDFSGWPRGRYFTHTFTSTRAGEAIAAAWAVMKHRDHDRRLDGGGDLHVAPHCGQCSRSRPKTRLSRRASAPRSLSERRARAGRSRRCRRRWRRARDRRWASRSPAAPGRWPGRRRGTG